MREEVVRSDITVVAGGPAGVRTAVTTALLGQMVTLINNRLVPGASHCIELRGVSEILTSFVHGAASLLGSITSKGPPTNSLVEGPLCLLSMEPNRGAANPQSAAA